LLFPGAPRGFRLHTAALFIGTLFIGTLLGLGLRLSAALLLLRKPFGFGLLLPIFFRDPLSFGFILLALRFFAGAPLSFLLRTPVGVYRGTIRY